MPSHLSLPLEAQVHHRVDDLIELGNYLRAKNYDFTAVTPLTHERVLTRSAAPRHIASLRDMFGWNRFFSAEAAEALPAALFDRLQHQDLIRPSGADFRATVRFATIGDRLYLHDGYPTVADDAVFFGPDTYRFVNAIERSLRPCPTLVDIGCGSGAGGLEALVRQRAQRVVLTDISARALEFARVNTALAGQENHVEFHHGDLMAALDVQPDAIIANPPYLVDHHQRLYRNGGGDLGLGLALRILRQALERLRPGGQLLLYTGAPVRAGIDEFAAAALPIAQQAGASVRYEEIDPDVFGEELEHPAYAGTDRIAAVLLDLTAPPSSSSQPSRQEPPL